jgi:hypothetical protein
VLTAKGTRGHWLTTTSGPPTSRRGRLPGSAPSSRKGKHPIKKPTRGSAPPHRSRRGDQSKLIGLLHAGRYRSAGSRRRLSRCSSRRTAWRLDLTHANRQTLRLVGGPPPQRQIPAPTAENARRSPTARPCQRSESRSICAMIVEVEGADRAGRDPAHSPRPLWKPRHAEKASRHGSQAECIRRPRPTTTLTPCLAPARSQRRRRPRRDGDGQHSHRRHRCFRVCRDPGEPAGRPRPPRPRWACSRRALHPRGDGALVAGRALRRESPGKALTADSKCSTVAVGGHQDEKPITRRTSTSNELASRDGGRGPRPHAE